MSRTLAALVAASLMAGHAPAVAPQSAPPGDGVAFAVVDWPGATVVSSRQLPRLQQPMAPGSFVKIATLAAAFAAGVASPDTRVPCAGEAVVGGEPIRCNHPRLRHPIRPAEALALSCNVWFATIGDRLPRAKLDAVLTALGLPPTPARAPMVLAAPGLRARSSPPLTWLAALGRLLGEPGAVPLTDLARSAIIDGLRGAALYGTASGFSDRGLDVLAKTGTAAQAGGGSVGVVVSAWPALAPTRALVLVAAGVGGRDAAQLAADIVANGSTSTAGNAPSAGAAASGPPVAAPSSADVAAAVGVLPPPSARTPATTPSVSDLRVRLPRAGAFAIETMALDDYVARVLAGEAAAGSPAAALEALAISVRTFAVRNRGRHQRESFDLCATTHCQVVREASAVERGVARSTSGEVLLARGQPAEVYYTASCGGRTERPSSVWRGGADAAHLPSARDRFCKGEPRWAAEIPVHDLERALTTAGFRGSLRDLDVDDRTDSGRVLRVGLEGMRPDAISGQELRMAVGRTLGWHLLKSTLFDVRRTGPGYRFDGNGFGHGVGLCVLGSVRRAERGDSAREILAAYFPGLEVGRLPAPAAPAPPPVVHTTAARPAARPVASPATTLQILLPPSAEPERQAVTSFARRALDQLIAATGQRITAPVLMVFHPSAESFRRETNESWWSAARTRGGRIDLLPLSVLRMRGTLEPTVRHELAHLLTEPLLQGRPQWVLEGVAMHFAGEPPPASLIGPDGVPRRARCPTDDDVRRPASATVARQAYALAAACVARALSEGVAWTEIR